MKESNDTDLKKDEETNNIISEKFKPAIEEIEKTINFLKAIRQALIMLEKEGLVLHSTEVAVATDLAVGLLFNKKD